MALGNTLDLTLLGALGGRPAFVAARSGNEIGFAALPDDDTITQLLLMRERIEASFYGREIVKTNDLEKYGQRLGELLLADTVGEMYSAARAKGVRINLVINDCELQRLPWEYMHAKNEFPGPQASRAIVRIVSSSHDAVPDSPVKPDKLSVLLAVSRGPSDLNVPLEDLTKAMEAKFAAWLQKTKVDLAVRPIDSFTAFSRAVAEKPDAWDVIHFLGHGEVRKVGERLMAGLILVGGGNKMLFLDALRLAAMLEGHCPRLLILSACATGQAEVKSHFSNLAGVLLRRSIPAVLANQMVITAESIAEFCAGVYGKLLGTGDIDEAVMEGRLQSFASLVPDSEETARVEWGVPVLYRHFGAQRLFRS